MIRSLLMLSLCLLALLALLLAPALAQEVAAVLPAVPAVAPAVVVATVASPWDSLLPQVLAVVVPVLGLFLATLLGWVSKLLIQWMQIKLTAAQDAALRSATRSVAAGVEEWAARKLKAGEISPESRAKEARALGVLAGLFPTALPATLARVLDEEIAQMAGCGATGEAVGSLESGVLLVPGTPGQPMAYATAEPVPPAKPADGAGQPPPA